MASLALPALLSTLAKRDVNWANDSPTPLWHDIWRRLLCLAPFPYNWHLLQQQLSMFKLRLHCCHADSRLHQEQSFIFLKSILSNLGSTHFCPYSNATTTPSLANPTTGTPTSVTLPHEFSSNTSPYPLFSSIFPHIPYNCTPQNLPATTSNSHTSKH